MAKNELSDNNIFVDKKTESILKNILCKKGKIMFKKVALALTLASVLTCTLGLGADAKTLARSFNGGSDVSVNMVGGNIYTIQTYEAIETCYASTHGYTEPRNYYLRAYIGGSSSSAVGSVADTNRQYFSGDNSISTSYSYGTYQDKDYFGAYLTGVKKAAKYNSYAKYGY